MASASNPLNQSSIDYSWSPCEILSYEGPKKHFNKCTEHFKNVQEEFSISESLKCLGEFVITVINAVPVLGHLAFIIEMIAVSFFEGKSDPEFIPLEQEDENSEQQELASEQEVESASLNSIEIAPELVDLETPEGCTALFIACLKGDVDAVKLLIEKGANVDIGVTRNFDVNSLKEAMPVWHGPEIEKGATPLWVATRNRNEELVQLLLSSGAKLYFNHKNYDTKNGVVLVLSSMEEYKFTCTRFPPNKNPEYYGASNFSYNQPSVNFIFKQAAMCGAKDLEKKRTLISVLSHNYGLPSEMIQNIYSAFIHAFTKIW